MARQHGFVQQLVRTQHGPPAKARRRAAVIKQVVVKNKLTYWKSFYICIKYLYFKYCSHGLDKLLQPKYEFQSTE